MRNEAENAALIGNEKTTAENSKILADAKSSQERRVTTSLFFIIGRSGLQKILQEYQFVRKKHIYFGKRIEVEVFGEKEYVYVYVDQNNALQKLRDYRITHEEEYQAMKDRDQDWYTVKFGYFVLLSNREETPEQLLTEYFERTEIETVFKTSKEYLGLLPLSKWTDTTVRGKLLHDIIDTIILLKLRERILPSGVSVSEPGSPSQGCSLQQMELR